MTARTDRLAALALCAALALASRAARAQDEGEPSPEDIKNKVVEIERLMRSAEEALARTTDTRTAEERSAEAARKMLDDMAKKETGKSADELRKEAQGGSKEAAEALEKLTKRANEEAKKAAEAIRKIDQGGDASGAAGKGVRELVEKVKGDGKGASEGIRWLLEKAVRQQQGGGGGEAQHEKQPNAAEPKDKQGKKDDLPPPDRARQPTSPKEPPRSPQFDAWLADLPPQVRKAYETEDWDSIPPRWREMLKEWTRKMADELEKSRR